MKFIIYFFVLIISIVQLTHSETPKKKEIKIDNRIICMKGKKGAKLTEIDFVGVTRTSIDLQTFLKQFKRPHQLPEEKQVSWISPKFIKGTLSSISRRECRKFNKLEKDEVYGIVFPNGRGSSLLSLFHDQDFKWHGAAGQLKYVWPELSNYEESST